MNNIPNLESRQIQAIQKVAVSYPAEKLLVLTLLESAEYLENTGRWENARPLADLALTIALRWHYFIYAGKSGMANIDCQKVINSLRAAEVIDRPTHKKFMGYISQPYTKKGLGNLMEAVKLFASAMIEPAEDNGRARSKSEAMSVYRACVQSNWAEGATRAAHVEGEPMAVMLLQKAAI